MRSKLESYVRLARLNVDNAMPEGHTDRSGSCYWCAKAISEILPATVVAGTYQWQFTNYDNGMNDTHFSCEFDAKAQSFARHLLKNPEEMQVGKFILPEMHVWNIYQGKVLDISTIWTPQLALHSNVVFEQDCLPPEYHFGKARHRNGRWVYKPHPLATELVRWLIKNGPKNAIIVPS
jgi:hypothetical protein